MAKQKTSYQNVPQIPCHSCETEGPDEAAGVPKSDIADYFVTNKYENKHVLQAFANISGSEIKESTIKKSPGGFGLPNKALATRQADIANVFNTNMLENSRISQAFT